MTGELWDTENSPEYGDEVNFVESGFKSGWSKIQGVWENEEEKMGKLSSGDSKNLVDFGGRGNYSVPELTCAYLAGLTAIKFLDSNELGKEYENDLFAGDVHRGNLYHFELYEDRSELSFKDESLKRWHSR